VLTIPGTDLAPIVGATWPRGLDEDRVEGLASILSVLPARDALEGGRARPGPERTISTPGCTPPRPSLLGRSLVLGLCPGLQLTPFHVLDVRHDHLTVLLLDRDFDRITLV
jgi:hypothetical protein